MPTGTRICKICGKEYPYCKTERPAQLYRWQEVACCPQHAAQYFEAVAISRGELPAKQAELDVQREDSSAVEFDDTDDSDEFADEDIDDDEKEDEDE